MARPRFFVDSLDKPYKTAPFLRRMFAFVLDSVIIIIVGLTIANFLDMQVYLYALKEKGGDPNYLQHVAMKNLITDEFSMFFIVGLPYHLVAEQSSWQGSIGKRILGMIVTDKDASKPSFLQSLLRNFFKFAIIVFIPVFIWQFLQSFPPLVFIVWVIILIMAANDGYNRFLSDFPTKSFVLLRNNK